LKLPTAGPTNRVEQPSHLISRCLDAGRCVSMPRRDASSASTLVSRCRSSQPWPAYSCSTVQQLSVLFPIQLHPAAPTRTRSRAAPDSSLQRACRPSINRRLHRPFCGVLVSPMSFSGHRDSPVAPHRYLLMNSSTEKFRAVVTRCNFDFSTSSGLCTALPQTFRSRSHGACRATDHTGTMKRFCKRSLVFLLQSPPSSFRYRFHPLCMFNYWPV
jgi:hypothetical protein